MESFEYNVNPGRVIFGSGSIQKVPSEVQRLSLKAPFVLSTPHQASLLDDLERIFEAAGVKIAGKYSNATMHTPVNVTMDAIKHVQNGNSDCIVSIGGGSTIGLGKAISFQTGLPHVCIPTTYAGSEMTPILGETKDGKKTTQSHPQILPGVVIYDVDLTMTLPSELSATSGVNALAHAIESLYASNTNPVLHLYAIEAIRALAEALPVIVEDSQNKRARSQALYGAWLCGVTLGSSAMALHHKLCHTLGGSFNLPHAETHTIVLPHALSYNAPAISTQMADIAAALPNSDGDAIHGLNELLNKLKVKRALKDFGMQEEDIDKATDIAMSAQYPNPRQLERDKIREVIYRCWAGEPAKADL